MTTSMDGGVHSRLAETLASHLLLHCALISGGFTSPLHFGAFICTLHEPSQVPEHLPFASISQEALHSPLQVPLHEPCAPPVHLPSQEPLHATPFDVLPSHLPSHLPSQLPLKPASQSP